MDQKMVVNIGWFASSMAVVMYVSYIDQIIHNIAGQKGSVILPAITIVNCLAWVVYGVLKEEKDWPIIICNAPGILLGTLTVATALA